MLDRFARVSVSFGEEPRFVVLQEIRRVLRPTRIDQSPNPRGRAPMRSDEHVGLRHPSHHRLNAREQPGPDEQPPTERLASNCRASVLQRDDSGIDAQRSELVDELHDDDGASRESQLRQEIRHA